MGLAGAAWGGYSLLGRASVTPLVDTARSFLWASPLAIAVSLLNRSDMSLSRSGLVLALVSGVVTSGIGYAIWYSALARLTRTRAAAVQLLVPVLAALGGVVILNESPSARLAIAAVMILGGVGLVLATRANLTNAPTAASNRTQS